MFFIQRSSRISILLTSGLCVLDCSEHLILSNFNSNLVGILATSAENMIALMVFSFVCLCLCMCYAWPCVHRQCMSACVWHVRACVFACGVSRILELTDMVKHLRSQGSEKDASLSTMQTSLDKMVGPWGWGQGSPTCPYADKSPNY